MDNVVRHGTILIDIKTGTISVNAPELAKILGSQKEQAELQEKMNQATANATRLTNRHTESIGNQARQLREAGEGAFIFARGIALMTAGSDDDLQKMIRNVAAVQAGFDLFRGSTKVIEGLSAALGVSRVATVALLSTLTPYLASIAAIGSAYALWTNATREQKKAEEELLKAQRDRLDFEHELRNEQEKRILDLNERIKRERFEAEDTGSQAQLLRQRESFLQRRLERRKEDLSQDPENKRLQERMLEVLAELLEIQREIRDKQAEIDRVSEARSKEISESIGKAADAIGGVLSGLWGKTVSNQNDLQKLWGALQQWQRRGF